MKLTFFLFLSFFGFTFVFAQGEKNFIDQNYIEVIGKAELEVTPDLIYIQIRISEKDPKSKITVEQTEKLMFEKLQGLGIDLSKDLVVKNLASNFKDLFLSKAEIILSRDYQLVVHDGKTAGKVFVELEKAGISNTNIERVDHSRIQEFRRDVKVNAVKAAHDKSEALAKAVNQNIGRAIFIQEMEGHVFDRMVSNSISIRGTGAVHRGSPEEPEPDINFEKIKLESSILVRFELK